MDIFRLIVTINKIYNSEKKGEAMRKSKNKIYSGGVTEMISKSYSNLVKYYLLKILVDIKVYKSIFEEIDLEWGDSWRNILHFLDFSYSQYTENLTIEKFFKDLSEKLKEIEKSDINNTLLDKNIEKLSKIIFLNEDEKKLLKFVIVLSVENILQEVSHHIDDLNIFTLKIVLSTILDIDMASLNKILNSNSLLKKSNLIEVSNKSRLCYAIKPLSGEFAEKMVFEESDIYKMLQEYIKPLPATALSVEDYSYLQSDINNLLNLLKKNSNANVLLYGLPGTGKTELAKLLAKQLNKKIYEVSYLDENDEPIETVDRLANYKFAQYIFRDSDTILLYDEAEDIFSGYIQKKYKAWINRSLEENFVSTIWISNDITFTDRAILRRFDYILKVPIPPKKVRKAIIRKYADLSDKTVKKLASHKYLSPAVVSKAIDTWQYTQSSEKELIKIINHMLTAQGYGKIPKKKKKKKEENNINLPNFYSIDFINSNVNVKNLIKGLEESQRANICIYGIPGTGKSAFGKYIAKKLNKEVLLKRGSDLLSPYVGETEQNIARAFKEAKEKRAVLIFDEVDTFLQDRRSAVRSWEISQVNEMLTQMEEFDGIFIATTNLMDNLDEASLRRFDVKMEFKPLKPAQIKFLSLAILKHLQIPIEREVVHKITKLQNLTFGDFNVVVRQHKINKITSTEDFYNRLLQELKVKKLDTNPIGF